MERRQADVTARPMVAALLAAVASITLAAHAGTDGDLAADLFEKGLKKREAGKCESSPVGDVAACKEARDYFRRAYALNPTALGALRNLAYVEKSLGMVASATRHFREVARKAPLDPKPERQLWAKFATQEADVLEPRVPHLTVTMPKDRPGDAKVTLDEDALAEAAWGTSLDVDPGVHVLHVEATGRLPFNSTITLAEKDDRSIDVKLELDPSAAKPAPSTGTTVATSSSVAPPSPSSAPSAPSSDRAADRAAGGSSRVLPAVVAGVGLVGTVVGLAVGAMAKSKRDGNCDTITKQCDPDALDSARSLATTSTIVTGVSAAVLVSGVVWFFLTPTRAPSEARTTWIAPYVGAGSAGVAAGGRF